MSYLDRAYTVMVAAIFSSSGKGEHHLVKVSFKATQTIYGISLEQYNTSLDLDATILKEAFAQTMTGVLPSNIKNFRVTGPTSAARSKTMKSSLVAPTFSASSITLDYTIVVFSSMTAGELMDQLTTALSDGTFNVGLHDAALEHNATTKKNLLAVPWAHGAPPMNPMLLSLPAPPRRSYCQPPGLMAV